MYPNQPVGSNLFDIYTQYAQLACVLQLPSKYILLNQALYIVRY